MNTSTACLPNLILQNGRIYNDFGNGVLLPYKTVIQNIKEDMQLFGVDYPRLVEIYEDLRDLRVDPHPIHNLQRSMFWEMVRLLSLYDGFTFDRAEKRITTHTYALRDLHQTMRLPGKFQTASSGSTYQNCFMFFRKETCAWFVERFNGAREHDCWTRKNGRTWIYYNLNPEIEGWQRSLMIRSAMRGLRSC